MDTFEIKKVNEGTDLADKLICFVEDFSWKDVKDHMSDELFRSINTFRVNVIVG